MLNIKYLLIFSLLAFSQSYQLIAQSATRDYYYYYSELREPCILDACLSLNNDSTLEFSGGMGQYQYFSFGTLKRIEEYKFLIIPRDTGGIKVETIDETMRKVHMLDDLNDTLYFREDRKSFIYKNREFILKE